MSDSIKALVGFINQYAPFNQMDEQNLVFLLENCTLSYFPAGTQILSPAQGKVEQLYILKQGEVRGERISMPEENGNTTFVIGPGDCFQWRPWLGERHTDHTLPLRIPFASFVQSRSLSRLFTAAALQGLLSARDQQPCWILSTDRFNPGPDFFERSFFARHTTHYRSAQARHVRARHPIGTPSNACMRRTSVSIVIATGMPYRWVFFTPADLRRAWLQTHRSILSVHRQLHGQKSGGLTCQASAFEAR